MTDHRCPDRQADLIDISDATDIHNTKFDDPSNPIADDGDLDSSINPANYVSFVSFIDSVQLARFGVHNGACIALRHSCSLLNGARRSRQACRPDPHRRQVGVARARARRRLGLPR